MVFDSVISQGTLQTRFGPFQTEIYASSDLANCRQFYPIHRMNLSLVRFELETRSGMLVQMLEQSFGHNICLYKVARVS